MKVRALSAVADTGETTTTKGGAKFTWVGADMMSGHACPTLSIADKSILTLTKNIPDIDVRTPVSTIRDSSNGKLLQTRWHQTASAGWEKATGPVFINDIFVPSVDALCRSSLTAEERCARYTRKATEADPDDLIFCDGLKEHHGLKFVRACREKRVRTGVSRTHVLNCTVSPSGLLFDPYLAGLRFPHGSHVGQHEDFVQFACFKPGFEKSKSEAQKTKVKAVKADAAARGVEPSPYSLVAAQKLSEADVLLAAKEPWEKAFSHSLVASGWAKEGIFPKFNQSFAWKLHEHESLKTTVGVATPSVLPDEKFLKAFSASTEEIASVPSPGLRPRVHPSLLAPIPIGTHPYLAVGQR